MSIRAQGMLHKCQRCYARQEGGPKFKACSQCKAAKYCSIECQKADWKRHKPTCKANAEYAKILEAYDSAAPSRRPPAELLPDNMSLYDLDQLLEVWVRTHMRMLMVAWMHAIRFPDDYRRLRTHVLTVQLRALPRSVHGGDPARALAVTDAFPLTFEEGRRRDDAWRLALEQLHTMQVHAESIGAGGTGAAMIECPPLAVQWVPFGSLHPVRGRVQENWKDLLVEDVREGRTATTLTIL